MSEPSRKANAKGESFTLMIPHRVKARVSYGAPYLSAEFKCLERYVCQTIELNWLIRQPCKKRAPLR